MTAAEPVLTIYPGRATVESWTLRHAYELGQLTYDAAADGRTIQGTHKVTWSHSTNTTIS